MRFFKLLLSAGSTLSLKLLNFPVAGKNPYSKPFPIRSLTQLFYLEEAWLNFFVTLRDGFKKLNAFSITFDSISKIFFLCIDPETNRLSDQVKKDRLQLSFNIIYFFSCVGRREVLPENLPYPRLCGFIVTAIQVTSIFARTGNLILYERDVLKSIKKVLLLLSLFPLLLSLMS